MANVNSESDEDNIPVGDSAELRSEKTRAEGLTGLFQSGLQQASVQTTMAVKKVDWLNDAFLGGLCGLVPARLR